MTSNKQDPFSSMQKPTGGLSSTSLSAGNTAMGHDLRGPSEPYNIRVQGANGDEKVGPGMESSGLQSASRW